MTPCNGACVRLRWQVRRDEQEKQSQPRQPDPSLERWFLPLLHFLCRGMRLVSRSTTTPSLLPLPNCRCPSRHRLFRRCLLYHLAHHLARHLRFRPGHHHLAALVKHGLPLSATQHVLLLTACGAGVIHLIAGGARATAARTMSAQNRCGSLCWSRKSRCGGLAGARAHEETLTLTLTLKP